MKKMFLVVTSATFALAHQASAAESKPACNPTGKWICIQTCGKVPGEGVGEIRMIATTSLEIKSPADASFVKGWLTPEGTVRSEGWSDNGKVLHAEASFSDDCKQLNWNINQSVWRRQ